MSWSTFLGGQRIVRVYAICAVVERARGAPHHRSLALRRNPDALAGELDPVEVAEARSTNERIITRNPKSVKACQTQ
jgi:hypothetical protein